MLSYHNDPALKAKYIARFAAHREADQVIQGLGYENGRGCFVGCTLEQYDHELFPVELGWPEWLAYLADKIFEGLPKSEAPQFGTDLLEAVPVGVDLEPVQYQLAISRHERQLIRLADNKEPYAEQCRAALQNVINYLHQKIDAEFLTESAWAAAEAAVEAARSAWSAARSAAEAAAWSAESAARSAWSAA